MKNIEKIKENFTLNILLLSILWGFDYILIKVGIVGFSPYLFVTFKLLIGAISIFFILKINKTEFKTIKGFIFLVFLASFFDTFLPQILISLGERSIPSSLTSILLSSSPIFTFLLASFFANEKFSLKSFLIFLLGFLGVVVIFGSEFFRVSILDYKLNLILILFASISYAFGVIFLKKLSNHLDPFLSSFYLMIFGTIFSIVTIFIFPNSIYFQPNLKSVVSLLIAGIVLNGFGYAYFFFAISKFGAQRASFVGYLVPFFATIYGIIFLHEQLRITTIIGGAIIILSSYLLNLYSES